jgi:hypothetical protein
MCSEYRGGTPDGKINLEVPAAAFVKSTDDTFVIRVYKEVDIP